ncbi:uncharacterized protein LOC118286944 [Scophthalmus maximus]|uniref:uncharacterized protein LOC118286944 n=1 Tax=Scophthalmus maximus TaxID=52904 RepID=UPI0015E1442F|nr:uncharacterized protein LOC118286944 [Scophthalmus maximus]
MENPDQDMELRQSSSQASRVTLNTGDYSEPQQEHEPEPESNQETPEPTRPPRLELLEFRTEQLHNRRFLLLRMEHMRKKAVTFEDSDETCELESIESELEELQAEKKALEEQGESSTLTENGGQQDDCPTYYKSGTVIQPCGGIYILPPPRLTQEDIAVVQTVKTTAEAETPTGPITPAGSLCQMSAVTRCPSCEEVVFTETQSTVGDTVWLLCCLCTMMGCAAGCCLIPFCLKGAKNVQHRCPRCQAHIHTFQPL